LKKANGTVADFDRDGSRSWIYPPGVYTLQGGLREVFALPATFKVAKLRLSLQHAAAGGRRSSGAPGAEIVVVEGPPCAVRCHGQGTGQVGRATGFTSVAYLPGSPRGSVISAPAPTATTIFTG